MPTPSYLTIHGSNQGLISRGACAADSLADAFVEGHEDEILVQSYHFGASLPTDRQSGQPSGQRVHRPMKVTFEINKSLPLLYNSLCQGELLNEVVLGNYRTSIYGKQERFFETILTNARVVDIELLLPDSRDAASKPFNNFVNVWFSFRKIEHIHLISGTLSVDDWRKPVEA